MAALRMGNGRKVIFHCSCRSITKYPATVSAERKHAMQSKSKPGVRTALAANTPLASKSSTLIAWNSGLTDSSNKKSGPILTI